MSTYKLEKLVAALQALKGWHISNGVKEEELVCMGDQSILCTCYRSEIDSIIEVEPAGGELRNVTKLLGMKFLNTALTHHEFLCVSSEREMSYATAVLMTDYNTSADDYDIRVTEDDYDAGTLAFQFNPFFRISLGGRYKNIPYRWFYSPEQFREGLPVPLPDRNRSCKFNEAIMYRIVQEALVEIGIAGCAAGLLTAPGDLSGASGREEDMKKVLGTLRIWDVWYPEQSREDALKLLTLNNSWYPGSFLRIPLRNTEDVTDGFLDGFIDTIKQPYILKLCIKDGSSYEGQVFNGGDIITDINFKDTQRGSEALLFDKPRFYIGKKTFIKECYFSRPQYQKKK